MQTPKRKGGRGERTLITIHGIRTDGAWQECFHEVFGPHFHYESFKYPQFQHSVWSVVFLALEWFALIPPFFVLVWAWRDGLLASPAYWAVAVLFILSSFLVASLFADSRRDQVVTDFVNFVDQANGSGLPPHVVAHSLGSFVLGRMLFRYPEFKAGKVVLLGCVLKPELDWGGIRGQFQLIRNELGAKDWVSSVAALLSPFIREMGSAGKKGFHKPIGFVANLKQNMARSAWKGCICGVCSGVPEAAVLNIEGQDIGHNDLPAVTIRARRRWLPYFWDIPPDYFESFVELCLLCDGMEENGDPDLSANLDKLLKGCWYWTRGPLEEFLHIYLQGLTNHPDEQCIRSVATNLYRTIAEATRTEEHNGQKLLFPLHAVKFSAQRTLGTRS